MYRSLFPAVFLSFGFAMIALAKAMPLFEWSINGISANFPSNYEVHIAPSPWKAQFGDSLDYGPYVSFGKVYVSKGEEACRYEDLKLLIKRSQIDETLDQASLIMDSILFGIIELNWAGIFLCVIFIWWFIIWHKGSVGEAIIFSIVAIIIYYEVTQIARVLLPKIGENVGILECYRGEITLNAKLTKIHFETWIISLMGILTELAAIAIILIQMIRAITGRNKNQN